MGDRERLDFIGHATTATGTEDPVNRSAVGDGGRPSPTHTALTEASELLLGSRQGSYGDARITHERISQMWNAIVPQGKRISPSDVALMMIAVKVIRASKNPRHRDSWVDIAGYAEIGAQLAKEQG